MPVVMYILISIVAIVRHRPDLDEAFFSASIKKEPEIKLFQQGDLIRVTGEARLKTCKCPM